MIKLIDILTLEQTACQVEAGSKKRTLEITSILAAKALDNPEITQNKIFDCLIARERLGSTGIGEGIAIPHCRLAGLNSTLGVLLHLQKAVAFDAIDNKPVDIVLTLLVPEESTEEHLQLLAALAEHFSKEKVRNDMRCATDNKNLYDIAVHDDE